AWRSTTTDPPQVHRRPPASGISLHTLSRVTAFTNGSVTLANQFTNAETRLPCASLVIVGTRFANDTLYAELMGRESDFNEAGLRSVTRIGDALARGAIVHAVYSGHRYAEELDAEPAAVRYRRDAPLPRHS